jgi:hypothetical protein
MTTPETSQQKGGRHYHDKTIHVIVLESESEEEIAKVRRSVSLGGARGVNILQFKIGDDVLRALLAALEESARSRRS